MSGNKSQHPVIHDYQCINFVSPFHYTIVNCMVDNYIINICIPNEKRILKWITNKFGMASIIFLFILLVPPTRYFLMKILILTIAAMENETMSHLVIVLQDRNVLRGIWLLLALWCRMLKDMFLTSWMTF